MAVDDPPIARIQGIRGIRGISGECPEVWFYCNKTLLSLQSQIDPKTCPKTDPTIFEKRPALNFYRNPSEIDPNPSVWIRIAPKPSKNILKPQKALNNSKKLLKNDEIPRKIY